MDVAVQRRLFTVEDFHALAESGILTEEDRVELIEGEIIEMPSPGPPHVYAVNRLNMLLTPRLLERAIVSVQNPVVINPRSEPLPDVAVLRYRDNYYADRIPDARLGDVLLVVEVAASSLRYDREVKLPLYARAGVPEVWVVAVEERVLDVYRRPAGEGYEDVQHLDAQARVHPEAFPDAEVAVADLLP